MLRILVGLLLAPLIGLTLFAAGASVAYPNGDNRLFDIALALAYFVTLVLGIPLLWMFHRLRLSRWWHYIIGGAVFGVVGMVLLTQQPYYWRTFGSELTPLVSSVVLGALCAFVYWLIANASIRSRHNP